MPPASSDSSHSAAAPSSAPAAAAAAGAAGAAAAAAAAGAAGAAAGPQPSLTTLKLLHKLKQARAEHANLKAAVHEEVDLQRASERTERLRAELASLEVSHARLDARLCYGLPPGWREASGASPPAGSSGDEWASRWLGGTEVVYSIDSLGGSLKISHAAQPARLCVFSKPFAKGGLRQAFYARGEGGERFVLKQALIESSKPKRRVVEVHADAEATALSAAAATAFTHRCATRGQPLSVSYLPASVVVLSDPAAPGGKAVYLKEPWLDLGSCTWAKWTRNDGHIMPDGEMDAGMQAFAHFSLHYLRPRLGGGAMVLDAQGIKRQHVGRTVYTLTDPALCSSSRAYGRSDMGGEAILDFLRTHTCGRVCSLLGCSDCKAA